MAWRPFGVVSLHLACSAALACLAPLQAPCAASGTLEVPALRIGQGTGKLVPVIIDTQGVVGRLSFRLTLDAGYGTWGAEGSLVDGGDLDGGFVVSAEVAADDARSLDVAIAPKTGQESSTISMVAAGRSVLAYAYATPKLGLSTGRYTVAVSQVAAFDTKGSPIDLSPVAGSLTVAAGGGRLPGDLDLNGKVSVADCVIVLKLVAGIIKPGGQGAERFIALADVSPTHGDGTVGDGKLDVKDLVRLLKHVAGLEPGPWPGGLQYASAEIGPGGGAIALADGSIALSVPPGAIGQATTITLRREDSAGEPNDLGSVNLLPDGLTFAVPATLTVSSGRGISLAQAKGLSVETVAPDGQPEALPATVDANKRTLSVQLTHFTVFRVKAKAHLNPGLYTTLTGAGVQLHAFYADTSRIVGRRAEWVTREVTADPKAVFMATPPGDFLSRGLYMAPAKAPKDSVRIDFALHLDELGTVEPLTDVGYVDVIARKWKGSGLFHVNSRLGPFQATLIGQADLDLTIADDWSIKGTAKLISTAYRSQPKLGDIPCVIQWIPASPERTTEGTVTGKLRLPTDEEYWAGNPFDPDRLIIRHPAVMDLAFSGLTYIPAQYTVETYGGPDDCTLKDSQPSNYDPIELEAPKGALLLQDLGDGLRAVWKDSAAVDLFAPGMSGFVESQGILLPAD